MAPINTDTPTYGGTIQAVECVVLSLLGLAWLSIRTSAMGAAFLDTLVLWALASTSVFSLVACTLHVDNRRVHGAFFASTFALWALYLYLLIESTTSNVGVSDTGSTINNTTHNTTAAACCPNSNTMALYTTVFFGGTAYHEFPAGISLAIVTVVMLVAASAVHLRVWKESCWADAVLLLVCTAQSLLQSAAALCPAPSATLGTAAYAFAAITLAALVVETLLQGSSREIQFYLRVGIVCLDCLTVGLLLGAALHRGMLSAALLVAVLVPLVSLLVYLWREWSTPATSDTKEDTTPGEVVDTAPSAPPAALVETTPPLKTKSMDSLLFGNVVMHGKKVS